MRRTNPGRRDRSQHRQRLLAIVLALLVVVALSALAINASTVTIPDRGGTFTEATTGVVTTLNPLLSVGREPDEDLTRLLFAGLMRTDERGALVPDLAARWEISSDGRTYAFQLRPNLRWHDGSPLTARDVVATASLLREDGFPGVPDVAAPWRRAAPEWIDDTTVRFQLEAPDSRFLAAATIGIVPAHLLGGVKAVDLLTHATNARPVGSGPFRFVSGSLDEVVLESYAGYHFGQPYIQQIKFHFFPSAAAAREAVSSGEADGYASVEPLPLPASPAATKVLTGTTTNLAALSFNVGDLILADPPMRQALGMAIDRDTLVKVALKGWAEPSASLFPRESWVRDRTATEPPATIEQARALIERAGWQPGADGIRERDGRRLAVSILTTPTADRQALANGIAQQWRGLGVDATVSVSDTVSILRDAIIPHKFGAALLGIDLTTNPDLYLLFHSSQAGGAGFNFSGYGQPDLDRLVDSIRRAGTNEQRARLLRDADGRNRAEATIIPIAFGRFGYLISSSTRGVRLGVLTTPADRFANVHDWYFRTKRVLVRPGDTTAPSRVP